MEKDKERKLGEVESPEVRGQMIRAKVGQGAAEGEKAAVVPPAYKTDPDRISLISFLQLVPDDYIVEIVTRGTILDMLESRPREVIFNGVLGDFCRTGDKREWNALDEAVIQVEPWEDPDTIGPCLRIQTCKDGRYLEKYRKQSAREWAKWGSSEEKVLLRKVQRESDGAAESAAGI